MLWKTILVPHDFSSPANHATTGELFFGSIGFHSPSGTSLGSNASPEPGIVAVMRVRPAGPMQFTVTLER